MSGGLLIVGKYYIDPKDASGNSTGLIGPLNTIKCEITHLTPTEMVRISYRNGPVGQALDTIYVGQPPEISIATDDVPSAMLNLLFGAEPEPISEAATTVTAGPVTLIKDRWVKLPHRNLFAPSVNVSTAAMPGTPLILSVDYQIDLEGGLIMAISPRAAVACLADYTTFAVTGTRHNAARRVSTKCGIIMVGVNMVNGRPCRLTVDEAVLYRSDAWDAANNQYVTTALKGKLTTLPGLNESYRYEDLTLATY